MKNESKPSWKLVLRTAGCWTLVLLLFSFAATRGADPSPGLKKKKSLAGGWSYVDPKLGRKICKVEIMNDHTFMMSLPNEESPGKSRSGLWRHEGGILEFVTTQGDTRETLERGRISNWVDNRQFSYKVLDGVKPAGMPGRTYEFRRE